MESKLIRDFSKDESQDERDALAGAIKVQRKEERIEASRIENLTKELNNLEATTFSKVSNFLKILRLKAELNGSKDPNTENISEFEEPKKLIENFYRRQEEKWAKAPVTKEDIEKYFDPEYLAALSIDDYGKVLARFGGGMVTHVTRQGIRDHADMGMMGHFGGMGEMHNGFKGILQDKKMKYNLAFLLAEDQKDEKIADYFGFDKCKSKEEALNILDSFTSEKMQHFVGSFVDMHGPHFAVRTVSNRFYGAEEGNDIFYAYPSYMIASNYYHRRDPHIPMDASNYNDLWVYLRDDDEIKLDSGIVFIPEKVEVDPRTGSRYEVTEEGKAIPDQQLIDKLKGLVANDEFQSFAKVAKEQIGTLRHRYSEIKKRGAYGKEAEHALSVLNSLSERLKNMDNSLTEAEIEVLLDYRLLMDLSLSEGGEEDVTLSKRLADLGMYYKKSQINVQSKEYWEQYFAKHSDQRPNKVVYYKEGDPTEALLNWESSVGVRRNVNNTIPFKEKQILDKTLESSVPEEITEDLRKFRSMVIEVIDRRFSGENDK